MIGRERDGQTEDGRKTGTGEDRDREVIQTNTESETDRDKVRNWGVPRVLLVQYRTGSSHVDRKNPEYISICFCVCDSTVGV